MKKIFGIALVLALMASLCFSTVALADDPPEVTVDFNVTDPDITVTAYKGPFGVYQWDGTAQFTLTGSSSATGSVTADFDGVFECYTDYTGQPRVYGGYTASGGDFQSTFSAFSYMLDGPSYFGHGMWTEHSIDATGVTDGSMTVNGGAIAAYGCPGGFVEGWQTYAGEAEEVVVFGSKMDSTKQGIDPDTWNSALFTGAEFTATASASSTLLFSGQTEAGTYPQGGETSPCRVLTKQGLGFAVFTSGSSVDTVWNSNYAYNIIDAFVTTGSPATVGVVGESSTWFTGVSGGGYNAWEGIPGYLPPPPLP